MSRLGGVQVKLWQLPAVPDLDTVPPQPLTTLTQAETHVELVLWHPTTHGLLATTAAKQIALHDVETQQADSMYCDQMLTNEK